MKQETTYGKEAAKHAKVLISQGWTNEEIKAVHVCRNIPFDTLRLWRFRMKPKNETPETLHETPETADNTAMNEQGENTLSAVENDETPVSKPLQSVSFWREWLDTFHPADLLYYLAVALAAAGIVQALHLVGYPVAVLFCSGAFIALHGIKTCRGWKRLPHFAIMSVIEGGSFTAHTVWANTALWGGVKGLPLDIWENKYRNDMGEIVYLYGGNDVAVPGTIAIGIASFMLAFTLYVCWLAVQKQTQKP